MNTINIAIIGFGVIGKAINTLFENVNVSKVIYDPYIDCNTKGLEAIKKNVLMVATDKELAKQHVNKADIAFVCVPTPHKKYDGLDMSAVEDVISLFSPKLFVICSALQPGTADHLAEKYNKKIVVQPEYFGETVAHPLVDMQKTNFLILGGDKGDLENVISLYQKVYNANTKIRKVTRLEAEVIKLSENRAIGYKVAQCQELYDACQAAGVDYDVIREAVYGDDPRFNLWWTFVYKNERGLSSKCIPKDLYGWQKWAFDNGCDPQLTISLLEYNKKLLENNGRIEP